MLETTNKMSKGQTFLEFAVLIGVMALVFASMSLYVTRAANANLKLLEEEVNSKQEQSFNFFPNMVAYW